MLSIFTIIILSDVQFWLKHSTRAGNRNCNCAQWMGMVWMRKRVMRWLRRWDAVTVWKNTSNGHYKQRTQMLCHRAIISTHYYLFLWLDAAQTHNHRLRYLLLLLHRHSVLIQRAVLLVIKISLSKNCNDKMDSFFFSVMWTCRLRVCWERGGKYDYDECKHTNHPAAGRRRTTTDTAGFRSEWNRTLIMVL